MKTIIQIKTLNLYLNENNYSTKKIKLYLKEIVFIKSPLAKERLSTRGET